MALEAGTTLGSYSVTAKICEGGMGEVYQATDTKLGFRLRIADILNSSRARNDRSAV